MITPSATGREMYVVKICKNSHTYYVHIRISHDHGKHGLSPEDKCYIPV